MASLFSFNVDMKKLTLLISLLNKLLLTELRDRDF